MPTTLQAWDGVVAAVQGLKIFADVRAHPLHKIEDAEFFKSVPDLQLPACLVVRRGGSTENHVATANWSAVLAFADADGKAAEEAMAALDAFRSGVLGHEICDGEVWVKPGSRDSGVASDPQYCVWELTFETATEQA